MEEYSNLITSKLVVGLFFTPFRPPIAAKLMIFFRDASSKVNEVRDFFSMLLNKCRSLLLKYADNPSLFGAARFTFSADKLDDEVPEVLWPFE